MLFGAGEPVGASTDVVPTTPLQQVAIGFITTTAQTTGRRAGWRTHCGSMSTDGYEGAMSYKGASLWLYRVHIWDRSWNMANGDQGTAVMFLSLGDR